MIHFLFLLEKVYMWWHMERVKKKKKKKKSYQNYYWNSQRRLLLPEPLGGVADPQLYGCHSEMWGCDGC